VNGELPGVSDKSKISIIIMLLSRIKNVIIYIYSSPLLILINPHQTPEDSPFTLFTFFSIRPFYRAFARGLEVLTTLKNR